MRNFEFFIEDIIRAMDKIEEFVGEMTFEDFKADDKTSSAVLRKLEIIEEASKYISEDIRKKYPQIPWKEMAGMRDKLIHSYSKVDYKLVWMTIKERIPKVKPLIEEIIKIK